MTNDGDAKSPRCVASSFGLRHSSLRLLVDPPLPGAWNMAVDEALLEDAAERGGATLRFYRWDEPTLSLGYFQRYEDRNLHEPSLGAACVRRRSGGGAILHDRELTYSLTLPEAILPAPGAEALYRLAHERLIEVLGELLPGCGPRLRLSAGIDRAASDEPFMCFERRSEGDVVVSTHTSDDNSDDNSDTKVIGSAQRKRRGAVLQHGSILLGRSKAAPALLGLAELCERAVRQEQVFSLWAPRMAESLGLELQETTLPESIKDAASRILDSTYARDDWTRRR